MNNKQGPFVIHLCSCTHTLVKHLHAYTVYYFMALMLCYISVYMRWLEWYIMVLLCACLSLFTPIAHFLPSSLYSTFIGNNGTAGGIVNAFHSPVHFQNYNRFINNIGPCIQVSCVLYNEIYIHINLYISILYFHAYALNSHPIILFSKASDTLIEVSGDMLWINNTAPTDGGAIYLTSHAQLRLHPSANLTFVSNRGR